MVGRPGAYGTEYEGDRDGLPVVVKLLYGVQAPTPRHDERLTIALEQVAAVSSPYLVPVVDHGLDRDARGGALPWVVTRRPDGVQSLDRVLARDAAHDPGWVHSVLLHIAHGLSDLHTAQLLHFDVCAETVVVDAGGRAWLTDFEIANVADVANFVKAPRDQTPGRWLCVPPEHLVGQTGPPADLWAYGLLAHELLTGRHPLEEHAHGGSARIARAAETQPLVSEDVPAPYDVLVRALLCKMPNGRPQQARHVVSWLRDPGSVSLDPPIPAHRPLMRWVVQDANEVAAAELGSADELAVGVVDASVRAQGDLARLRRATSLLGVDLAVEPVFAEESSQGELDLIAIAGDPMDTRVRSWFARAQGGLHDVVLLPFVDVDCVGIGAAVDVLRCGVQRRGADDRPVIGTIRCSTQLLLDSGRAFALLAACAAIEVDGWRLWIDGLQPGCGRSALRATRDAAEALAVGGTPVWVRASGVARWVFLSTPGVGLHYRAGRGLWTSGGRPRRTPERVEIERFAGPVERDIAERIAEHRPDLLPCECSVCRGRLCLPPTGPGTIIHNVAVVTRLMPSARDPVAASELVGQARRLREAVGREIGCDSAGWRTELRDLENAESLLLERDATQTRGALILAA